MKYLTFSPLALKISGSSVVLQTRCKSVVLPAFDLPRTRILKWPMRSKYFLTSAGSSLMSATMSLNNVHTVIVTRSSHYSLLASSESEARCSEFLSGRANKNLLKRPGAILSQKLICCEIVSRESCVTSRMESTSRALVISFKTFPRSLDTVSLRVCTNEYIKLIPPDFEGSLQQIPNMTDPTTCFC